MYTKKLFKLILITVTTLILAGCSMEDIKNSGILNLSSNTDIPIDAIKNEVVVSSKKLPKNENKENNTDEKDKEKTESEDDSKQEVNKPKDEPKKEEVKKEEIVQEQINIEPDNEQYFEEEISPPIITSENMIPVSKYVNDNFVITITSERQQNENSENNTPIINNENETQPQNNQTQNQETKPEVPITETPSTETPATETPATETNTIITYDISPIIMNCNDITTEKLYIMYGDSIKSGNAFDLVCRVVENEIGSNFGTETIKAQAVAAYTYIKYCNNKNIAANVLIKNYADENVKAAVKEVLGKVLYYNGNYALCTYCAVNSGYTSSAVNVWGGGGYPYLTNVESPVDKEWSTYKTVKTISSDEFASRVREKAGVEVTDYDTDKEKWIEITSINDTNYVATCRIGNSSFKGTQVRSIFGLRSHSFEISYNKDLDVFIFTNYGYGHGVGMSQVGAHLYDTKYGWTYDQILAHYYPGTVLN